MSSHQGKFEQYLKQKEDNDDEAPCNHPEIRIAVFAETVKAKTDDALRVHKRLGYRLKKQVLSHAKINDLFDGYTRVMGEGLTEEQKKELDSLHQTKVATMKAMKTDLDKAQEAHTEVGSLVTELNNEAKKEVEKGKRAAYRNKRDAILRPLLIELAAELKISTKQKEIKAEDRYLLDEVFLQFRRWVFDFVFQLASCLDRTAFLCRDCWTIIFLVTSKLKKKGYIKPSMVELRKLFSALEEEEYAEAIVTFYKGLGLSEEDAVDEGWRFIMPAICLPGDRQRDNRGHNCLPEENKERDILRTSSKDTRSLTPSKEGSESRGSRRARDPLASPTPERGARNQEAQEDQLLGKRRSASLPRQEIIEEGHPAQEEEVRQEASFQQPADVFDMDIDQDTRNNFDTISICFRDQREKELPMCLVERLKLKKCLKPLPPK